MTTQTKKIIFATGGLVAFFGIYEIVKTLLYPRMSVVTSHIISTVLVGIISVFIARYVFKTQASLLTEREQANQKLREALGRAGRDEVLLRSIVASVAEGLVITDQDTNLLLINDAAKNLLNLGSRPVTRLTDITRDPNVHRAFSTVLSGGESFETRIETRTSDNPTANKRILHLHAAPLRLADGQVDGVVCAFIDISKIEMLERIRQEFLSNVSHELRTPLASITAYVETLIDGGIEDSENSLRFLNTIHRNAERMRALVNDISELSAIESGAVRLAIESLPLKAIVDEVFSGFAPRAAKYGVRLNNEVPEGYIVTADRRRIEQILINLVDNGIKFNHPGGYVVVSAENSADGLQQTFRVRDTGPGIPADSLPRVFERFYRVDKARSREAGGTGLGLAIVKHLARAHGGEAFVKSEVGSGSEFSIRIPCSATTAQAAKAAEG
ncbi:MAG: PAS domain-containing protein [Acidobacteriota bacterium]|nr:MAG: PAS domain-containing protein [Acidobacteriota bacterium]